MIGFYDSGIGGKRIADIFARISTQPYICYQDTKSLPLGDKTPEQIQDCVLAGIEHLFEQGCNLVVLACNTASVSTIRYIQSEWLPAHYPGKQVLGVTAPLREYLGTIPQIKLKRGLLMATQATIETGFYQEYLREGGYQFDTLSCPGLAEAIEYDIKNDTEFSKSRQVLQTLSQQIQTKPDYIILACTHYGYSIELIQHIFKTKLILDPSYFIADRLVDYLKRHPEYR